MLNLVLWRLDPWFQLFVAHAGHALTEVDSPMDARSSAYGEELRISLPSYRSVVHITGVSHYSNSTVDVIVYISSAILSLIYSLPAVPHEQVPPSPSQSRLVDSTLHCCCLVGMTFGASRTHPWGRRYINQI
jgi:hypothetical protein